MAGIQYCTVIENQAVIAEVCDSAVKATPANKARLRSLAVSIASAAKPGETSCITSATDVAYFIRLNQYVVIAFTQPNISSRLSLAFLRDVQAQLKTLTARGGSVRPQSIQEVIEKAFGEVSRSSTEISSAKAQMNDVKKVMISNIDELLQRNERLSLLVDRTSEMSHSAQLFSRQAGGLERKMWYSKMKFLIIATLLLAVFGVIIVKVLLFT